MSIILLALLQQDFPWRTDLDAAMQEGADTGKPLCIVFR